MIAIITITDPKVSSAHSPHILRADVTVDCPPVRIEGRMTYLRSVSDPTAVVPMWGVGVLSSDLLAWSATLSDRSESQIMEAVSRGAGTYEIDVCEAGESGVRR